MPPAFPPSVVPCLSMIAVFSLAWSSPASAQLRTYSFQAVVDSVDSTSAAFADRNLGLVAGSTITGTFVIDLSAYDTSAHPAFGTYRNYDAGSVNEYNPETKTYNPLSPLSQASLALDLPKGGIGFGTIRNDYAPGSFDTYEEARAPRINVSDGETHTTESGKLGSPSGDSLNFYQDIRISSSLSQDRYGRMVDLLLNDSSGSAFSSDHLPSSLELSDFDNAKIYFKITQDPFTIQYPGVDAIKGSASFISHITSFTAVPEPSSLGLSALAGGLMMTFRRRK